MAIIGDAFNGYVTKQIKVRQEALGEGLNSSQDIRSIQTQNIYNSSTPWMRLASAVKITEGDASFPGKSIYQQIKDSELLNGISGWEDEGLAKMFVLQGAPNSSKGKQSPSGVNIDGTNPFLKAYGWGYNASSINSNQGYIPPPGVVSLNFEYKNDGALAMATVNIKAFSQAQFAMIDILYMRPGYTCLLEFGHTMYLDNDGKIKNLDTSPSAPLEFLFQDRDNKVLEPLTYTAMSQKISSAKELHDGNYEAFFGRISKFNWKLNSDGSYDITIKLTGLGDVISSLKTNIPKITSTPSSISSSFTLTDKVIDGEEGGNSFIISNALSSQLNFELYALFAGEEFKHTQSGMVFERNIDEISFNLPFTEIPVNGKLKNFTMNGGLVKFDVTAAFDSKYSPTTLIKFGGFLAMLQKICNITDNSGNTLIQFEIVEHISEQREIVEIGRDNTFIVTYPGNFSSNPNICLIKYEDFYLYNDVWVSGNRPELPKTPMNDTLTNTSGNGVADYGSISNPSLAYPLSEVYINLNHIATVLDGLKGSDNEADSEMDVSILDLLRGILRGVNTSLGGINNFRVLYNENTSKIEIISESPILEKSQPQELATLNTYGFEKGKINEGSFIKNLDLNSELTDQMATQISIGAQNNSNTVNGNSTSYSTYSKRLIDNLFPSKDQSIKSFDINSPINPITGLPNKKTKNDQIVEVWNEGKILEHFKEVYSKGQFDEDNFIKTLQNVNSSISPLMIGRFNIKSQCQSPFFLPFNMSLEMHGLGGMKIYESFQITGRGLPLSYNPKEIKLIIKSLSHSVSIDGWKTKISTLSQPIFNLTEISNTRKVKAKIIGGVNQISSESSQRLPFNKA